MEPVPSPAAPQNVTFIAPPQLVMVTHPAPAPCLGPGDTLDVQFIEEEVISMSRAGVRLMCLAVLYCGVEGLAQPPAAQLNPAVKKIVDEVSEERIEIGRASCRER